MAQISIHVGTQNGSRYNIDLNPSGTLLSITAYYYLPPIYAGAEPHIFSRDDFVVHTDSPEEMQRFIAALAAVQFPAVQQEPEERTEGIEVL